MRSPTGYLMSVICAFGREEIPERLTIEIEIEGSSTRVCPRCLTLITVHRRYHHMDLERLIPQMTE